MFCLETILERSTSLSSVDSSASETGSSKLVDTCKNCSFTFRIGSKNSSNGFCSKDCETCFTLFYKGNCFTPCKQEQARDVKLEIFQFQCQLDQEALRFIPDQVPLQQQQEPQTPIVVAENTQTTAPLANKRKLSKPVRRNLFF